jgi:cytochrome c biogenesis protein CcmG/thiol:disulfide interchange protein DsbE
VSRPARPAPSPSAFRRFTVVAFLRRFTVVAFLRRFTVVAFLRRFTVVAFLRRLILVASTAVLAAAGTAACTAEAKSSNDPPPFADCAALTAAPPSAPAAAPATGLPDLRLPCFTGGKEIALRDLHGPALINIWGSWCQPCRAELPVIQHLADRTGGRLTVLTVDTGDSREAGASFAGDKGVTLPTLYDQGNKLLTALKRINLPITLFIDADGHQFEQVVPLTAETVDDLVRTHTGVTVAS